MSEAAILLRFFHETQEINAIYGGPSDRMFSITYRVSMKSEISVWLLVSFNCGLLLVNEIVPHRFPQRGLFVGNIKYDMTQSCAFS